MKRRPTRHKTPKKRPTPKRQTPKKKPRFPLSLARHRKIPTTGATFPPTTPHLTKTPSPTLKKLSTQAVGPPTFIPPPGLPPQTYSQSNFCDDDERSDAFDEMRKVRDKIRKTIESEPSGKVMGTEYQDLDIGVKMITTNDAGITKQAIFTSFQTLRKFMLSGISAYIHGERQVDWTPDGLCQYAKRFEIGVAVLEGGEAGKRQKAWFPIHTIYGPTQ